MPEPGDTAVKSLLNRMGALGAAQEQLQGDVDKIRAGLNAAIVLGIYTLAIGVLIFIAIRWPEIMPKAAKAANVVAA